MRTTIRWMIAVSLAVVAMSPALCPAQADDGRADLSGTWRLTAWEINGERLPPVMVSEVVVLNVEKGTYRLDLAAGLAGGLDQKGTFKIVSGEKGVFQVDLKYTRTGPVGESNKTSSSEHTEKAIWKLVDKDTLWMCSTEGKDRPDSFTTKKGDDRHLNIYKREKK
ncbi:MAG TPA: hypothetical protein VKE74_19970 [Gemmataceae bacterium]|nr:hypothetical protein [Gemmataceae bacterium]